MRPMPTTPNVQTDSRRPNGLCAGRQLARRSASQLLVVIGDALSQRHHQGDRVVGDLARAVVRRVADGDPQLAEALDVDIVVADAVLHEDAAFAQLVDVLRRAGADDGVCVGPLVVRHLRGVGAEVGLEARADRVAGDLVVFRRKVGPENAHRHPVVPRRLFLRRIMHQVARTRTSCCRNAA